MAHWRAIQPDMASIRTAPRPVLAIGAALLVVAAAAGLMDVARRSLNSDFTVFVVAGAAFFDGRDPYEVTNTQGWHYAYTPLFALLVSPLARLSLKGQVVVWYLISLSLGILCVAECRWIVRSIRRRDPAAGPMPGWIAVATALSALLPALDSLQRGQVGLAIMWLLLLGLRLALGARGWLAAGLAGVVLALPVEIKLTPLLPVAVLVLVGLRAGYAGGGGGTRPGHGLALGAGLVLGLALFVFALPGALLGWSRNVAHLEAWARRVQESAQMGVDYNKLTFRNQSFPNAAEMLARWEHPRSPLRGVLPQDPLWRNLRVEPRVPRRLLDGSVWAVQIAVCGLVVAAAWRLAGGALGAASAFGLGSALSLVVSPVSWAHHFVALIPAVLFVPWWLWCRGGRTAARWLSWAFPALVGVHYLLIDTAWVELHFGLSLVWTVGLLGMGTALWCGAASVLVLAAARSTSPS